MSNPPNKDSRAGNSNENKGLNGVREIYRCECGLNSHVGMRHGISLSPVRTETNSSVRISHGTYIITYFLREAARIRRQLQHRQQIRGRQNHQRWEQTKAILHRYTHSRNLEDNSPNNCKEIIMEQLVNDVEGEVLGRQEQYPLGIEDIVLYYNDFVLHYIPVALHRQLISLHAFGQAENELIKLWRWLRREEYISSTLQQRVPLLLP